MLHYSAADHSYQKTKGRALVGDILTGVAWIVVDVPDSAVYKSSKDKVNYDLQKKLCTDKRRFNVDIEVKENAAPIR
ncbi:MAG: hypothetical protein M3R17_17400 [Bacteroidota bacterium]|nr:hypothetical protein [Bacteroidota bacterium]